MEQLSTAVSQVATGQNCLEIQPQDLTILLEPTLPVVDLSSSQRNKRKRHESPTTNFTLGAATFGDEPSQKPFVALGFQIAPQPARPKRSGPLSKQLTLVTEDGKFKCPFCQRPFQRRHDAQRHSVIHTRDKPYICRGCNARFPRADRRANHWKKTPGCWEKHHETPDCISEVTPLQADPSDGRETPLARNSLESRTLFIA